MKKFTEYINEDYNIQTVAGIKTSDLATVYRWLKWGNAAETGLTKKDPKWAKQRDIIGGELGKRARRGEEDAKRALNNRMTKDTDRYGKPVPIKITQPKKSLRDKIKNMIIKKVKTRPPDPKTVRSDAYSRIKDLKR